MSNVQSEMNANNETPSTVNESVLADESQTAHSSTTEGQENSMPSRVDQSRQNEKSPQENAADATTVQSPEKTPSNLSSSAVDDGDLLKKSSSTKDQGNSMESSVSKVNEQAKSVEAELDGLLEDSFDFKDLEPAHLVEAGDIAAMFDYLMDQIGTLSQKISDVKEMAQSFNKQRLKHDADLEQTDRALRATLDRHETTLKSVQEGVFRIENAMNLSNTRIIVKPVVQTANIKKESKQKTQPEPEPQPSTSTGTPAQLSLIHI